VSTDTAMVLVYVSIVSWSCQFFYALELGVVRESRTVGHGTNHLQWTTTKYTPRGVLNFELGSLTGGISWNLLDFTSFH
jgi:hypothetical protein